MAQPRPARSSGARGEAAALTEERAPRRGDEAAARQAQRSPELHVLTAADVAARRLRRRARLVAATAVAVLVAALLAVAGAQALVASQQVRLDAEQQQVASAVEQDQQLQLARAELASPQRVLQVAERQLGMVVPRKVTYLSAVVPGGSAAPAPAPAPAPRTGSGERHKARGKRP